MTGTKNGSRVDLHCHSAASAVAKLGVQQALGLPECATPPAEVHALAKRRRMDFVTITDHDTIAGVLEIADAPDVFIPEELTARFRGEPQAVHVLCLGITPDDHAWLQAHAGDVEVVAAYLHEREIACALAHPFFSVAAPLTPRHRRRLAELFPVWEVRNGARDAELNRPAAVSIRPHEAGVGGTDDHAGIDIGRTWTEAPPAATPEEFLAHVRAGRVRAGGEHGSAARWAHNAVALALRAYGRDTGAGAPDAATMLRLVERVLADADARGGAPATDLAPSDARALLDAWLAAVELDGTAADVLATLQSDDFTHAGLARRARRCHERKLAAGAAAISAHGAASRGPAAPAGAAGEGPSPAVGGPAAQAGALATALLDACIPAIPYAPAAAFLGRERRRLNGREHAPRVAVVADGIGAVHGVARALEEIRARGVPGVEVEVVGTDPLVDRRLPAVADVKVPSAPGLRVGVPGLPSVVDALAKGRYDLVHVSAPGPAGIAAALAARMLGLPLAAAHHTELPAYASLRSDDPATALAISAALAGLYAACDVVLSPSESADRSLAALGVGPERIARWDRGVDTGRFSPARRDPGRFPAGRVTVLHAGRLAPEKGTGLLADAFLAARARDPRLHLVCAGGGPDEAALRARLGGAVTMLGWLDGEELAGVYASADVLLLCSQTDTFGQVVLEAQASGLPVVAVAAGGPAELVADGRSGLLCAPSAQALAGAITGLAGSRVMRERLARGGLAAVRERSWEAALARRGEGWRIALAAADRRAAATPDTHPASAVAAATPDTHPASAVAAATPDTHPASADDPTEVMAA